MNHVKPIMSGALLSPSLQDACSAAPRAAASILRTSSLLCILLPLALRSQHTASRMSGRARQDTFVEGAKEVGMGQQPSKRPAAKGVLPDLRQGARSRPGRTHAVVAMAPVNVP